MRLGMLVVPFGAAVDPVWDVGECGRDVCVLFKVYAIWLGVLAIPIWMMVVAVADVADSELGCW